MKHIVKEQDTDGHTQYFWHHLVLFQSAISSNKKVRAKGRK